MIPKIQVKPTPYDKKALLIDTYEIYIPEFASKYYYDTKNEVDKITEVEKPSLFYSRVKSSSTSIIKLLHITGFMRCETQLNLYNYSLNNYKPPVEFGKKRLKIEFATAEDYLEVISCAKDVFNHSRFHENPFVDKHLANARMRNWAEDMFARRVSLIVSRNKTGGLDGFLFYRNYSEENVELILGGCLPGKGFLAPFFWASFIEYFIDRGYNKIETKISASNIVIANIYIKFGFNIKETLFDFHKYKG